MNPEPVNGHVNTTRHQHQHPIPKSIIKATINGYLLRCKIHLVAHDNTHIGSLLIRARESPSLPALPLTLSTTAASNNEMALYWADKALTLAAEHGYARGVAKTHYYRGHCFRQRGAWRDAHWAYVRAASFHYFAGDKTEEGLNHLTELCARLAAETEAETRHQRIKRSI